MNFKHNLLAIAIAIILAFFVGYGIEVFHDSPERTDFCPEVYEVIDEKACMEAGGIWNADHAPKGERGFCSNKIQCHKPYEDARESHDKVVFIVSLIAGVIAILIGMNLKHDSISRGLSIGGVFLLLYGTMRYWTHANDILKFVLLGIALAILLWIGIKKLK
jgi:hypothetical protein